jgi:hypothetical protein
VPDPRSRWRPPRPSASAATIELEQLDPQAPTPRPHRPATRSDDEVLYRGRRAPLAVGDWEALGWPAEKAREHARHFPHNTRSEVLVISADGVGPLEHYPYHSPTGFNWGNLGSGCAELARCILLHHHGVTPAQDGELYPPTVGELPVSYQRFKADIIAALPERSWTITAAEIRAWERRIR